MSWFITTITYNVNKQKPAKPQLDRFFNDELRSDYDLICIAIQELPHPEIFDRYSRPIFNSVLPTDSWTEVITSWMSDEKGMVLLTASYLASNLLLVYSKEGIIPLVDKIDVRWARYMFFEKVGYKGTLGVRLAFKDFSSVVFMTSHFAANIEAYDLRVKQFKQGEKCTFEDDPSVPEKRAIFWLGDMNWRIDGISSPEEMVKKLSQVTDESSDVDYDQLAETYDQLRKALRLGNGVDGFQEASIKFQPTYRHMVGLGTYDLRRVPSWCDRVLYKGKTLSINRYSSYRRLTLSDHFPVFADFTLNSVPRPPAMESKRWSVVFEPISTWNSTIPLFCRFSFNDDFWKKNGSYMDWVGLYPHDIKIIQKPITYVYLLTCYEDLQRIPSVMVAEFSQIPSGKYRMGYYSFYKNCLHGLSQVFEVKDVF